MTLWFIALALMGGGLMGIVTYGSLTILLGRWLPVRTPKVEEDETFVILL